MDCLNHATICRKIDLASGYYQVEVHLDQRYHTAFHTHSELSEYIIMPLGLCNTPALFQKPMSSIFDESLDKIHTVYLDNIFILLTMPVSAVTQRGGNYNLS